MKPDPGHFQSAPRPQSPVRPENPVRAPKDRPTATIVEQASHGKLTDRRTGYDSPTDTNHRALQAARK